jgi:hypothetical protein
VTDAPDSLSEVVTEEWCRTLFGLLTREGQSTNQLAEATGLSRPDALLNLRKLETDRLADRDIVTHAWVRRAAVEDPWEAGVVRETVRSVRQILNAPDFPARHGCRTWAGYLSLQGWSLKLARSDARVLEELGRGRLSERELEDRLGKISPWVYRRLSTGHHREIRTLPLIHRRGKDEWELLPAVQATPLEELDDGD